MKKVISTILTVTILINFIFISISYAEEDGTSSPMQDAVLGDGTENTSVIPNNDAAAQLLEEGTVRTTNAQDTTVEVNKIGGMTILGTVIGYFALVVDILPLQLQLILSTMTMTKTNGDTDVDFWATIERIVFNTVPLFNINYFDTGNDYSVGTGEHKLTLTSSEANLAIKKSVTRIYMVCRTIAIVLSLLTLIYIGIRMATSNIATDEAKYKKMLISWAESVILIFTLVYIMVLIISFGEMLTNIFYDIKCQFIETEVEGRPQYVTFETKIVNSIINSVITASGLKLAMYSLMYWILVFSQFKFFYLYIKRVLTVGFLIMIAPLITITYSIDKVGDGKAQAFSVWFSEFIMNVLIQPLHALIYMVFMFTAGEIATFAPIVGLLFLLSLGSVEKMVKVIFNVGGITSLGGVNSFSEKYLKKKKG